MACLIVFWGVGFFGCCLSNCIERSCLERLATVCLPLSLGCLVLLFFFIKFKRTTYVDWKQKLSDFEEFKSICIMQFLAECDSS